MNNKNKKGFTLAEVLITLSIIGVIAAILFPSILANYTERTLKAKRQALFGRMSQAMGEMADQFGNYESVKTREKVAGESTNPNCSTNPTDCVDNGSALKFINEGLSKVYKIAAVCDNENLSSCDIPDEITLADGALFSLKENGVSLMDFNPQIRISSSSYPYNLNSAGFMTKNGESILLFYNPSCSSKVSYTDNAAYSTNLMCVNMIYDLNGGKNKPNRMGEDIGFMTVFYNDSPYLVSPKPYDWRGAPDYEATTDASGTEYINNVPDHSYAAAKAACAMLGDNIGLPSLEEGMSMQINRELWAPINDQHTMRAGSQHAWMWTTTMTSSNYNWLVLFQNDSRLDVNKGLQVILYNLGVYDNHDRMTRCVYKD